jgi:hypothetical protein
MSDILQKWRRAQQAERAYHTGTLEDGVKHYKHTYEEYFRYTDTATDQTGKTIIEIGCADVPGLYYCQGYRAGVIIEPMPSEILKTLVKNLPIVISESPAEDVLFPTVDEVWLFNVLQHVIDPDVIINKAKEAAKVVRFFEPVNDGIDECHLHTFTFEYFVRHFGSAAKYYPNHTGKVVGFHEHESAYGVWINPEK